MRLTEPMNSAFRRPGPEVADNGINQPGDRLKNSNMPSGNTGSEVRRLCNFPWGFQQRSTEDNPDAPDAEIITDRGSGIPHLVVDISLLPQSGLCLHYTSSYCAWDSWDAGGKGPSSMTAIFVADIAPCRSGVRRNCLAGLSRNAIWPPNRSR